MKYPIILSLILLCSLNCFSQGLTIYSDSIKLGGVITEQTTVDVDTIKVLMVVCDTTEYMGDNGGFYNNKLYWLFGYELIERTYYNDMIIAPPFTPLKGYLNFYKKPLKKGLIVLFTKNIQSNEQTIPFNTPIIYH